MTDLETLLQRVLALTALDRAIDAAVGEACGRRPHWYDDECPQITASLDGANELFAHTLPNWWISSGICSLGPHASCGPEGRAFDAAGLPYPAQWDGGFHVDFKHSAPEACARVAVMLQAMIATKGGA